MNFLTAYTFGLQKLNHCALFFFGVCCKRKGHVWATSDEEELNREGHVSHYREVLCLFLLAHSPVRHRKNTFQHIADTLYLQLRNSFHSVNIFIKRDEDLKERSIHLISDI
jgi:hypothetical protein